MFRAVFTPMLLLAVLIQAAFGCFCRHSHAPAAQTGENDIVSTAHDHHHGHGHCYHRGGYDHGPPPPPHFHFGGDGGEEHEHEESGGDAYTYILSRAVSPPVADIGWTGHTSFAVANDIQSSATRAIVCEGIDALGRSGWPSGQRLSLLGVWLI